MANSDLCKEPTNVSLSGNIRGTIEPTLSSTQAESNNIATQDVARIAEDAITSLGGPSKDLIEYPSGMHYITILGELIGDNEIQRLTKSHTLLSRDDPDPRRDRPDGGPIDEAEALFLEKRGAFLLPPQPLR